MAEGESSEPVAMKLKHMKDGPHKGKAGIFDGSQMVGHTTKAQMKACMDEMEDYDDDGEPAADKEAKMKAKKMAEEKAMDSVCLREVAAVDPKQFSGAIKKFVNSDSISVKGIYRAQEIDKLLNEAAADGKFTGAEQRTALFKWAVDDYDSCEAYLSAAKKVIDFRKVGIEGNSERQGQPTQDFLNATKQYMKDHNIADISVGMREYSQTEEGRHAWDMHLEAAYATSAKVPVSQ
jgi:hypothetical protein